MRVRLCSLLLPALLAAQAPRIGIIDFYGAGKLSQERLRQAMGVKEGDLLPRSKGDTEIALESIPGVVHARLEAACCEEGKAILYVGIEEKGAPHFQYRDPPEGLVKHPEEIHDAYVHFLAALGEAVRKGDTAEDLTEGHSLMANAACRAQQERFLVFAEQHLENLRDTLRNSYDEEQRAIAAYVIGYAKRKEDVIDDLQYALRDPDDTVRSNAMRALGAIAVLAAKNPDLGIRVAPTWFIEMLNSLIWTDRHSAAVSLVTLTENRDPSALQQLRERAPGALIDMARWKHLPHALPAFILLGRVLGLEEKQIQEAWSKGERDKIVARARKQLKP